MIQSCIRLSAQDNLLVGLKLWASVNSQRSLFITDFLFCERLNTLQEMGAASDIQTSVETAGVTYSFWFVLSQMMKKKEEDQAPLQRR